MLLTLHDVNRIANSLQVGNWLPFLIPYLPYQHFSQNYVWEDFTRWAQPDWSRWHLSRSPIAGGVLRFGGKLVNFSFIERNDNFFLCYYCKFPKATPRTNRSQWESSRSLSRKHQRKLGLSKGSCPNAQVTAIGRTSCEMLDAHGMVPLFSPFLLPILHLCFLKILHRSWDRHNRWVRSRVIFFFKFVFWLLI